MKATIKVVELGTNKVLAEIARKDLNRWCDTNGYLPHHKFSAGWVVVK